MNLRTLLAAPFVGIVYIALSAMLVAGWLAIQIEGRPCE